MKEIYLNDLITDHITGYFYNADLFGLNLIVDIRYGYFNATRFCDFANKNFYIWKELDTSKNLFEYIRQKTTYIFYTISSHSNTELSGTYACKELLLNIVSWAYPVYYTKFNDIVIYFAKQKLSRSDITVAMNGKIIKDKLNRILLQLDNTKSNTKKEKIKCETTCNEIHYCVTNCVTDYTNIINDKLDRILFQLENNHIRNHL